MVHEVVAVTRKIEVVGAYLVVDRPIPGVGVVAVQLCRLIAAAVIGPNGAERGLLVGVGEAGREHLSCRKAVGVVGGRAVFGILQRLGSRIARLGYVDTLAAVLDILAVHAMAAAGGQDQAGRVRRADSAAVYVALVGTHELVHVKVTAALLTGLAVLGGAVGQPAVQAVIPGRAVIGVNAAFVQVGAVGIIIGTGVGVQGIVPGQKAVAVGDIVFQLPVGFARQVRLVTGADTPAYAVHAVVALGVYHVAGRVGVEAFAVDSVDTDVNI